MKDIIKKRNINHLVHFTHAINLKSILINGIAPREEIDNGNITGTSNDHYRYDNCRNANSLSIEFPNDKMFYKLQNGNPKDWVVILLKPTILCDFDCAYCYTNAGNVNIYTTPIKDRMTKSAFEGMFCDNVNNCNRENLMDYSNFPTDVQAEVLVFAAIPPSYISHVIFYDVDTLKKYSLDIKYPIQFEVNDYFFNTRDYNINGHRSWR